MKILFAIINLFLLTSLFSQVPLHIYGVADWGGPDNLGAIFRTNEIGENMEAFPMTKYRDRAVRNCTPIEPIPGFLYGMTSLGGDHDQGTIFEFGLVTDSYIIRHSFKDSITGSEPSGSLFKASNGNLYGYTMSGGTMNKGCIFEYNITTGSVSKLYDFKGVDGEAPEGSLIQSTDGWLYGVTSKGGNIDKGVIFRYDIISGVYEKLFDFDDINGSRPKSNLLEASNGLMYGFTNSGGNNNRGVVFSFDKTSLTYLKLLDVTSVMGFSNGSFIQANNGILYGVTSSKFIKYDISTGVFSQYSGNGSGTPNQHTNGLIYFNSKSQGTITHFNPNTNARTVVANFGGNTGTNPSNSLFTASDGLMYGITETQSMEMFGALFSFDGYNFSPRLIFNSRAPIGHSISNLIEIDKKLYGFGSGGKYNGKAIYRFDLEKDSVEVMVNIPKPFPNQTTINSSYANNKFVKHPNGKLYMFTEGGGGNQSGYLLEYNPGDTSITSVFSLPSSYAYFSVSDFIIGIDGVFYGVNERTSSSAPFTGLLFSYNLVTNTFTILHQWTYSVYTYGASTLMQMSNGKLYGISQIQKQIFSYDILTNTYEEHFDYTVGGASTLKATLVENLNGKLSCYMSYANGTSSLGYGNFFEFDPILNSATFSFHFTNDSTGLQPTNYVTGSNGKHYLLSTDNSNINWIEVDPISSQIQIKSRVNTNSQFRSVNLCGLVTICQLLPDTSTFQIAEICDGTTFNKTSNIDGPTMTYQWMKDGVVIAGATNRDLSMHVTAADSGYYYCNVSNGCRSTLSDSVLLNVLPLPTIFAGADQLICHDSLTVVISDGDAVTYSWSDGLIDNISFSITSDKQYVLSGVAANGCINTDTVKIFVSPIVNAGQDTTVCFNSSFTLTASGSASSYTWDHNVIDGVAFNADSTRNYILTGSNALGCFNTDTMTITVLQPPTVIAGLDQSICLNSSTTVTASGNAINYSWNNNVLDGILFPVNQSDTFILIGFNAEGCSSVDSLIISVLPLPTVFAGADQFVCRDSLAVFHASGTAVTYSWNNNVIDGSPFTAILSNQYVVTGVDQNCTSTDTLSLTVENCISIWPGDIDNDFTVGTLDFFNVGLNFGNSGIARNVVTNQWQPQTSAYWNTTINSGSASGLNMAYADCNGDGLVNFDDTLAVHDNFGMTHAPRPSAEDDVLSINYGGIYFTSDYQEYGANEFVTINIHVGTATEQLENIYGIGFTINYIATGIVPGSLEFKLFDQTFIGDVATNAIRLRVDDEVNEVNLGLCRTDLTNVTAHGIIGQITFLTAVQDGGLELNVPYSVKTNAGGLVEELNAESFVMVINPLLTVENLEKQVRYNVFPNPSSGVFYVSGLQPELEYTLILTDITGKIVYKSKSKNDTDVQIETDLSSGSYILEISSGNSFFRKKLVVSSQLNMN